MHACLRNMGQVLPHGGTTVEPVVAVVEPEAGVGQMLTAVESSDNIGESVCWENYTVVKPVVQNTYKRCRSWKCIQGHVPMHAIFAVFIYFSCLSYLGHTSLLRLQTKTRKQSNSYTFFLFKSHNLETSMSSTVNIFVPAVHKRSKKCLAQKVGSLGFLRTNSHDSITIQ